MVLSQNPENFADVIYYGPCALLEVVKSLPDILRARRRLMENEPRHFTFTRGSPGEQKLVILSGIERSEISREFLIGCLLVEDLKT